MKALILSPAKLKESSLIERFEYYQKLLRNRIPIDRKHVKSDKLLSQVSEGWTIVALDESGDSLSSTDLAKWVGKQTRSRCRGIAFLVGAADGHDPSILKRADKVISLSNMTLPHQLCFVLMAEQLYRATTILNRESYHRE